MKLCKYLGIVTILLLVLLILTMNFREWMYNNYDPYRIDYDAPGVDITSEGP